MKPSALKPRVFIGCSSEALATAEIVKDKLKIVADCQLWNEGFLESNISPLESLSEASVLFDFAILLASPDDAQLKREKLELIARDNIIFEFGLYLGKLGKNRAYFIKERNLDLPSDLFGITLDQYKTVSTEPGKTLDEVCNDITRRINSVWETFELSFVPSTVLAVGYFENFVSQVCSELIKSEKREANKKNYTDFRLHIAIPDELPDKFQDQILAYLHDKHLQQIAVATDTRPYNFYLDFEQKNETVLELYDIPTTLSGVKKAIEMALRKDHIGKSERERILKKKEMNNFCRTLDHLIKNNPITKTRVKLELIDVN